MQIAPPAAVVLAGLCLISSAASSAQPHATLDDLKKLEITCFVPAWLPKGFHLTKIAISYDEPGPDEGRGRFPLYNLEYKGAGAASFSVDSAREGIGDRNLMETDDSEETELHSTLFGPVYIIYTPKRKAGVKKEIIANWVADANMKRETGPDHLPHPLLGRYHGFTATGISFADFANIIDSLHPIWAAESPASTTPTPSASAPKLHPKIFSMIESWISDGESPIVTEINLDAVEKDTNQFNPDVAKEEDGWTRCPGAEPNSFMRYRLLESSGVTYKAEYQENGGGSLTTASIIGFTIENRDLERDGHPTPIRVLHVSSCRLK